MAKRIEADALPELHPPYNVAPPQSTPIVRKESGKRRFALVRWELIQHWAKNTKIDYHTINARAETVASKPAFRNAFRYRRCLIPVDGFYEWQIVSGSKETNDAAGLQGLLKLYSAEGMESWPVSTIGQ